MKQTRKNACKCTCLGLRLPNVGLSKQKLSIQVADFYSVHVNLQADKYNCMNK